jgi:hypothetical protein
MGRIRRNDPCPCGSGKKFKHCHLGREEELSIFRTDEIRREVAETITSLPQVNYGRSGEISSVINLEELTGNARLKGIKFIDFSEYVALESFDKRHFQDEHRTRAALIVNPKKTEEVDPEHIYIAITPDIHDSSLIHEIAHVLDFLWGSGYLPGSMFELAIEAGIPMDHLDHFREFAVWLEYLRDRFSVQLDAEDCIIAYLNEHDKLLDITLIKNKDVERLRSRSREILEFLGARKKEIHDLIRDRTGYQGGSPIR